MDVVISILGAVVPVVVVFFVWVNLKEPLKAFLGRHLEESLASLGTFFTGVLIFFSAVRLSAGSLYGLRAGIGSFLRGVIGPGIEACGDVLLALRWLAQVAALFVIAYALLGKRAARPDAEAAQAGPGTAEGGQ